MANKKQNQEVEVKKPDFNVKKGVKTVACTATGAGVGVVGAVVGVAVTAAAGEVLLPLGLCIWGLGIAGGALGMIIGIGGDKKTKKE